MNPRACTNVAIMGAILIWNLTGFALTQGLVIALLLAILIALISFFALGTPPCNDTTRKCH
jgi:hypothetical protein